jgi:hypothetical protein
MRMKHLAIAALAVFGLCASGCPLMVGSLAYQGYEYHKTGKLPGMPDDSSSSSSSSASSSSSKKSSSTPSSPTSSNIE